MSTPSSTLYRRSKCHVAHVVLGSSFCPNTLLSIISQKCTKQHPAMVGELTLSLYIAPPPELQTRFAITV